MTRTATQPGWRYWLSILGRLCLGLVLTIWAVWQIDWAALAGSLRHLHFVWVAATLVLFLLGIALKLVRWRWLLDDLAPQVSWLALARALFLGQAVNIIAHGRRQRAGRGAICLIGAITPALATDSPGSVGQAGRALARAAHHGHGERL